MFEGISGSKLTDLIITEQDSVIKAMQVIDRVGIEVAMICGPDRKLISVVTDGDIRRHLIRGGLLQDPIGPVGNRHFTAVDPDADSAEIGRLLLGKGIKSMPVLDDQGRLLAVHTLHEVLTHSGCDSWAIIMAGGKGERLGDLTQAIPKPMLPVGDRPILEHLVQLLVSHGITRIFLSVNYLGRMIQDHFGDGSRFRCRIEYLPETSPLGTGGALGLLPERPTHPLLLMNGDLLTQVNLTRLLAFHRTGGHALTMAIRDHKIQVPFGVAETEGDRVTKIVEKPTLNYQINAGIYAIDPSVLDLVETGRFLPFTEVIAMAMGRGWSIGGYHIQEAWADIGLPGEFWAAQVQSPPP